MSFDTKCYLLAWDFLDDEPHFNDEIHRNRLAQAIQTTIEDTIAMFREEH